MATRIATPCRTSGCPQAAGRSGYCTPHGRDHERRRSARRGPSGWARQTLTATVIARDGGCVEEGPHAGRLEVDHVTPLSAGGTNDPANLVTRCELHHRAKTWAERGGR